MDIATLQAVVNEWFKNQTPLPGGICVTILIKPEIVHVSAVPSNRLVKNVLTRAAFDEFKNRKHFGRFQAVMKDAYQDYEKMTMHEFLGTYNNAFALSNVRYLDKRTITAVQQILTKAGYHFPDDGD